MTAAALLKFAHVLGAVLLVGNVVVTGVWSFLMTRSLPHVPRRAIARGIWWSDIWFTLGGGALLSVSGLALALETGLPVFRTPWILRGVIALGISTAVWLVVLVPLQRRMLALGGHDDELFDRVYARWSLAGWGATLPLVWAVFEMVMKRA